VSRSRKVVERFEGMPSSQAHKLLKAKASAAATASTGDPLAAPAGAAADDPPSSHQESRSGSGRFGKFRSTARHFPGQLPRFNCPPELANIDTRRGRGVNHLVNLKKLVGKS
jgi:hypothetical protein